MRVARKPLALAALAAAGLAAAFALIGAPAAAAYTIDQLPGLGYSVSVTYGTDGCNTWKAGYGHQQQTNLGSDCDPDFPARVDALVAATCPCAQTASTTTAAATTTDQATTTAPVTTAPTQTDPPPPATTTTADPVQAQIAALQAQIDQIRDQLVSLVKILVQWPGIDPGILSQLLALQPGG